MAEAFNPDKYLAEKTKSAPSVVAQNTPMFDPDKYLEEKGVKSGPPGLLDSMKTAGVNTLKNVGKMLDYPGGLVRTGLASVGGLVSGNPKAVTEQDVKAAFKGEAPTSAQYLERLQVPAGTSANIPFLGETSLRDVGGFALDVATDPLGLLTKGARALRPASAGLESAGKSIYKSGFKKIDEKLLEKGRKPLSDLMLAEGKTGSTKTIQKEAKKIADKALLERDELYKRAGELGATVDLSYPLANAEKKLVEIAKNPGQRDLAKSLSSFLDLYKKEGKVSLEALSDWKSALYDSLPETAFAGGKAKSAAKNFEKALAKDFKEAIEATGNAAEKGLGDKIAALNEKMSTVLGSDKAVTQQMRRATTTNAITPIDALAATIGGAGVAAAKKGADLSKTTYARTKLGKGLINLGRTGLTDSFLRRGLINANRPGLVAPGLIDDEEYRLGDR